MATIYVLQMGEYSDRHIVALFSDKKLAEKAMSLAGYDSSIEEYELDSLELSKHPQGCSAWRIYINVTDSTIHTISQEDCLMQNFEPKEERINNKYEPSFYMVKCWARDKEHAKKIALDKYYQWKYDFLSKI